MWLSLAWFVMHTWVMSNHFDELTPEQSGPLLLCNILCYGILLAQCCGHDGAAWVPMFVLWASVLCMCLVLLFESWGLISVAWVVSAICTQMTLYEHYRHM